MLLTKSEDLIKTYEKEITMKDVQDSFKQGWTGILQLMLSSVFRKVVKQIKGAPTLVS